MNSIRLALKCDPRRGIATTLIELTSMQGFTTAAYGSENAHIGVGAPERKCLSRSPRKCTLNPRPLKPVGLSDSDLRYP